MSKPDHTGIFPQYHLDHPSFSTLRSWWQELEHDRGERAYLKRSATLTEILLSPAFHRLLNQLGRDKAPPYRYSKLAVIAGLVARIKHETGEKLGTQMGSPGSSARKSSVSEPRMRRILAVDGRETDLDELYTQLRRALALLNDEANIADLAAIIWHWMPMDEKSPHDSRRRLACDYYAEAPLPESGA